MDIKVKMDNGIRRGGGAGGNTTLKSQSNGSGGKGENTTLKIKDCVYREKMGKKARRKKSKSP